MNTRLLPNRQIAATAAVTITALLAGIAMPSAAQSSTAQYKVVSPDKKVTYTDRPELAAGDKVSPMKRSGVTSTSESTLPAEVRQAAQRYPVTLYVTANCSPCDSARQFLQQRGIPHTEKILTTGEDGEALQRLTGGRDAPTVTIGAQVVRGMSSETWASYLDAAGYPKESKLPASYQFPAATPLTERRDAVPQESSARLPALLDEAKDVRRDPPAGDGAFKF